MPYQVKKTKSGYGLYNIDKGVWKSCNTTKTKAEAQKRLLNYIDSRKYKNDIKFKSYECIRMTTRSGRIVKKTFKVMENEDINPKEVLKSPIKNQKKFNKFKKFKKINLYQQ